MLPIIAIALRGWRKWGKSTWFLNSHPPSLSSSPSSSHHHAHHYEQHHHHKHHEWRNWGNVSCFESIVIIVIASIVKIIILIIAIIINAPDELVHLQPTTFTFWHYHILSFWWILVMLDFCGNWYLWADSFQDLQHFRPDNCQPSLWLDPQPWLLFYIGPQCKQNNVPSSEKSKNMPEYFMELYTTRACERKNFWQFSIWSR